MSDGHILVVMFSYKINCIIAARDEVSWHTFNILLDYNFTYIDFTFKLFLSFYNILKHNSISSNHNFTDITYICETGAA